MLRRHLTRAVQAQARSMTPVSQTGIIGVRQMATDGPVRVKQTLSDEERLSITNSGWVSSPS